MDALDGPGLEPFGFHDLEAGCRDQGELPAAMATSRTLPRARAPSHSRPPANWIFSKKAICLS
ncbi:MAG TPA: hypothetical protein VFV73_41725 [Streptosporangiaceae bacterium]|nr:hypothetical protein [Streptosporangiaceae bacterium]